MESLCDLGPAGRPVQQNRAVD